MKRLSFGAALLALALSGLLVQALSQGADLPTVRGDYVTGSSTPDEEELAWLGKFEVVHAGGLEDPLPEAAIARLRAAGVRTILVYDWLPGGYHYTDGEPDNPFMSWIYENRFWATLNPDGPFPHCTEEGYDWCEDYYYDLGDPRVRARRVDYLVDFVKAHGYDGVFFDWGNDWFLDDPGYETMRELYRSRHPDLPYSQAIAAFFAELRARGIVVQPNQGFRDPAEILPAVDLDMTESYITDYDYFGRQLYVEGYGYIEVPETLYYPVSEDPRRGRLADTLYYVGYLEDLIGKYAGPDFRGMVFMNYAAPDFVPTERHAGGHRVYRASPPRNAIHYGYTVAKLVGEPAYTEVPFDHFLERDLVYFYDLGEPLGESYQEIAGGYVRYYTGGLVLVGEWQEETTITLSSPHIPADVPVYDAFEEEWLRSGESTLTVTVRPHPDPLTGRMSPSGRVYVYQREETSRTGNTYYVAPYGDNANPGTRDRPWATPGYGSRQLQPGDTLVILGGRYVLSEYDADIITPPSGTADAWITIEGEEGNRPVLAGRNNLLTAINLSGVRYVRIRNLEITHDEAASGEAGWFRDGLEIIGAPAEHIILENLYIHHVDEFGMNIQDVDDLQILGCRIEYAGFGALGGPQGEHGGWRNVLVRGSVLSWSGHYYRGGDGSDRPYERPDGLGIEPSQGPVVIEDTRAEHNYGDGLDSKAANTVIRRAIVANNSCDGVKLWSDGSRVENTLIYGRGDGDAQETPWAAIVIDQVEQSGARFELINVTVDDFVGRNYLMYVQYDGQPVHLTVRNTIFSGRGPDCPIYIGGDSTLIAEHNLFFMPNNEDRVLVHGEHVYGADDVSALGPGNIYGDPLFVRPAWGQDGDYHLREGSPAIDAGSSEGAPAVDLENLPRDAHPDIGAYEYRAAQTGAVFRVTREGDVYAAGAYFCGLPTGCFNSGSGADVAEWVPVSEPVEPGDVLEFDPDHPGFYRKARGPCSRLVAGVVSSAPGVVLGEPGKNKALLALFGIVPVKASAENGPIRPGDLLTTASIPGYAMRCDEPERCGGALIGKALELLDDGEGMIKVLVFR